MQSFLFSPPLTFAVFQAEQPGDGLGKRPRAVRSEFHPLWSNLPLPSLLLLHLLLPIQPTPVVIYIYGLQEELHDRLANHSSDFHPRAASSLHPSLINSGPSSRLLRFPCRLCRSINGAGEQSNESKLFPVRLNPRRHRRLGLLHSSTAQFEAERIASLLSKR